MSLESFPPASDRLVFDSRAEISQIRAKDSWWILDGSVILRAFNFEEILQVIRYRLFPDGDYPRTCLLERNTAFLNDLLTTTESEGHESPWELSREQKVDEILSRSINPFQPVRWNWFPTPSRSQDTQVIADEIEAESHIQFSMIPFEEIVRVSLGYKTDAVEWFLHQHRLLYEIIVKHLRHHPEEILLYKGVEKVLRTKSPFAHRALVQSIFDALPEMTHDDIPRPAATPAFEFMSRPIQRLFLQPPPTLKILLNILDVLAIRFRRQYIDTHKMKWTLAFDTELLFIEDYYHLITLEDLALRFKERDLDFTQAFTLTQADNMASTRSTIITKDDWFRRVVDTIATNDDCVRHFMDYWNKLSNSVWDCCVASPHIVPDLETCTKILLDTRNYHSLTAMMDGIYKYRTSTGKWALESNGCEVSVPDMLSDVIHLINPAQNYATYLQHFDKYPGIPWIHPHLRDHPLDDHAGIKNFFRICAGENQSSVFEWHG